MKQWIGARLEKARWLSFAMWFALWSAFSWLAFYRSSPWTRALEAGGGALPESQPGFPAIEPQRSLEALKENEGAVGDYILWQALDIAFAALNVMIASIAIALALKATRLAKTPLRYLLFLPAIYFCCEIVENALVTGFAAQLFPLLEPVVLIQQAATTFKLAAGFSSMWLGLAGLFVAGLAELLAFMRRKT